LSRDPVREKGGLNLYAFVRNKPIVGRDLLGAAEVRYSLDITTDVEERNTGTTIPDDMAVVCACRCQPRTATTCPGRYMMSCAVLADVSVLIPTEENLNDVNRTFEQTFMHEMSHVAAFFWFAEECARSIEDGGFESRCYNTFFSCRGSVATIKEWWAQKKTQFEQNQAHHVLDPYDYYEEVDPVGPHNAPWDSYGPRGHEGRHLLTEAIAHHLP
jgi:hypothetical protein